MKTRPGREPCMARSIADERSGVTDHLEQPLALHLTGRGSFDRCTRLQPRRQVLATEPGVKKSPKIEEPLFTRVASGDRDHQSAKLIDLGGAVENRRGCVKNLRV